MGRNDDGHYVIDVNTGGEKEMGRSDKIWCWMEYDGSQRW